MVDLRCGAQESGSGRYRCQLLAGHDSEHAAMVLIGGARSVWSWRRSTQGHGSTADTAPGYPWAPSFPVVEASVRDLSAVRVPRPSSRTAAPAATAV